MRFICLEQIFHGDFFTWKVLSNWITFFGNWAFCSWNLGTKLRTIFEKFQHYCQNWIVRNWMVFLGKRSFFGWINVFKNFSRHSADVFWTLKTNCQNCVFVCPYKFLQEKNFPGEMFTLIVFLRKGAGGKSFCRNLWKKRSFGGKWSGLLSERDSTLPEGLFEGRHLFPKFFPIKKSFQTFSII